MVIADLRSPPVQLKHSWFRLLTLSELINLLVLDSAMMTVMNHVNIEVPQDLIHYVPPWLSKVCWPNFNIEIYRSWPKLQMLKTGFFHADPHPGNLAVDVDEALIYYDFGMMGEITPLTRDRLLELFFAVYERNAKKVYFLYIESLFFLL